jgi:hypothetical protein
MGGIFGGATGGCVSAHFSPCSGHHSSIQVCRNSGILMRLLAFFKQGPEMQGAPNADLISHQLWVNTNLCALAALFATLKDRLEALYQLAALGTSDRA